MHPVHHITSRESYIHEQVYLDVAQEFPIIFCINHLVHYVRNRLKELSSVTGTRCNVRGLALFLVYPTNPSILLYGQTISLFAGCCLR